MALPPQMTAQQIQEMLNIAAPTAGIAAPLPANLQMAGSNIGYIAGQRQAPYSPQELPEWMANFQQISPTLFAPNQGVFQQAPTVPSIQSTMPQGYMNEYADLERLFQESIAVDPSQFGDIYRGGTMLPRQTIDSGLDEQFDLAGAIAAGTALKEIYPYAEDVIKPVYDATEEFVQQELLDPAEEFVQQELLDPAEDIAKIPLQAIEDALPEIKKSQDETSFEKYIEDPFQEYIGEPFEKIVVEPIEKNVIEPIKESVVDPLVDKLSEFVNSSENLLDTLSGGANLLFDATGNIQNLIDNPTAVNSDKAVESVNAIGSALGAEGDVVPLPVEDALHDIGSVAAIGKALEDPSAANLAQAYAAADDLALTYTDINSLPAANMVGQIGTALAGIEALDGGIDSVGEAAAVAAATQAAAAIVEQVATDAAVKAAAASTAGAAGAASSFLGPVATIIAIEDILAEDLSVKDILQNLPLGIGRLFGGGGATFGTADLSRDSEGNYIIGAEASKNKGFQYILPETNVAGYVLKALEDRYGYEFDPDAWENVNKRVTFDTRSGKSLGQAFGKNKTQFGTTSQDIVVDALQKGALKATPNTPSGYLSNTDIDWGGLFAEAREKTGQSKAGTKDYYKTRAQIQKEREEQLAKETQLSLDALLIKQAELDKILKEPAPMPTAQRIAKRGEAEKIRSDIFQAQIDLSAISHQQRINEILGYHQQGSNLPIQRNDEIDAQANLTAQKAMKEAAEKYRAMTPEQREADKEAKKIAADKKAEEALLARISGEKWAADGKIKDYVSRLNRSEMFSERGDSELAKQEKKIAEEGFYNYYKKLLSVANKLDNANRPDEADRKRATAEYMLRESGLPAPSF